MDSNHKALYNSLRMNWILNPTLEVESWQVQDYRSMPLDEIFERLEDKKIFLTKTSFLGYAESADSPEELTVLLIADLSLDASVEDLVYLLLFELWRRLLPEKPCLSVFCDELDHQIHSYDQGDGDPEAIQDAVANLEMILDENVDQGADPHQAFAYVSAGCANDVESFLYDFIAEQIDSENASYAAELLDGFESYINDEKWFTFLRARIVAAEDIAEANAIIHQLVKKNQRDPLFNLELLSFLVAIGEEALFCDLVKKTAAVLKTEEDFQTLVSICADFYHRLDFEAKEAALQELLNKREAKAPNGLLDRSDPQLHAFLSIIEQPE